MVLRCLHVCVSQTEAMSLGRLWEQPLWIERTAAFLGGLLVGFMISQRSLGYRQTAEPEQKREVAMDVEEAISVLESGNKINLLLSPVDNSLAILESVLTNDLSEILRASIVYAMDVLKTDFTHATLPVGLTTNSSSQLFSTASIEDDYTIRDWLVFNYTPRHTNMLRGVGHNAALKRHSFGTKRKDAVGFCFNSSVCDTPSIFGDDSDGIREALEGVDEWEWDVWQLREASNQRPLQALGWHLLNKWNLIKTLKLDSSIVRNWLVFVESLYHPNSYHNSTHAADVVQAVHFLLGKCGGSQHLSSLSIFAVLVSAIMHDAGHDGYNNLYHQNALTDRALTFNDQSIQENFHCMTIFSTMKKDRRINFFDSLSPENAKGLRRMMVRMILATDMNCHFKNYQDFKNLVGSRNSSGQANVSDSNTCELICANILHAADISNPCRPFHAAQKWAGMVLEEFFAQGDAEKAQGLPVSPMCARETTLIPASQIGFINFVVLPYFQVLAELLPPVQSSIMPELQSNLQRWRDLEALDLRTDAGSLGPAASVTSSPFKGFSRLIDGIRSLTLELPSPATPSSPASPSTRVRTSPNGSAESAKRDSRTKLQTPLLESTAEDDASARMTCADEVPALSLLTPARNGDILQPLD